MGSQSDNGQTEEEQTVERDFTGDIVRSSCVVQKLDQVSEYERLANDDCTTEDGRNQADNYGRCFTAA
jgi:hypothetical protein